VVCRGGVPHTECEDYFGSWLHFPLGGLGHAAGLAIFPCGPGDKAGGAVAQVHRWGGLSDGKFEVATGTNGGSGHGFAFGETMGDLVADNGAEFGVNGFFLVAVADTAKIEVRAVADVALVLV
jgi:hypothetical protein